MVRPRKLFETGELNSREIAAMLKVSRATTFRELKKARERETLLNGHEWQLSFSKN